MNKKFTEIVVALLAIKNKLIYQKYGVSDISGIINMGYQKYGYQKFQVSYQIYWVLDILGMGNIVYQKYWVSEISDIRNIGYQK